MARIDHEWNAVVYPLTMIRITLEIGLIACLIRGFYRFYDLIQIETVYLLLYSLSVTLFHSNKFF